MIKKLFSLLLLTFLVNGSIWAQSMSDEQVNSYIKTATEAGKSQKQIMTELAARGVTRAQAERIKKRYDESQAAGLETSAEQKNRLRTQMHQT